VSGPFGVQRRETSRLGSMGWAPSAWYHAIRCDPRLSCPLVLKMSQREATPRGPEDDLTDPVGDVMSPGVAAATDVMPMSLSQ
jgi:hypothetical protein